MSCYEPLPSGEYLITNGIDPGNDKIKEVDKCMPSNLGILVLSHSERILNKFLHVMDGFYSNETSYQDTDSLYMHMDHYEKK